MPKGCKKPGAHTGRTLETWHEAALRPMPKDPFQGSWTRVVHSTTSATPSSCSQHHHGTLSCPQGDSWGRSVHAGALLVSVCSGCLHCRRKKEANPHNYHRRFYTLSGMGGLTSHGHGRFFRDAVVKPPTRLCLPCVCALCVLAREDGKRIGQSQNSICSWPLAHPALKCASA